MDPEKQRQRRRDGARLTESGNARSEQLLVVPTESLTNRQRLLEELLSGSERRRPGWFLDMKYQTCFLQNISTRIFSNLRYCRVAQILLLKSAQRNTVAQYLAKCATSAVSCCFQNIHDIAEYQIWFLFIKGLVGHNILLDDKSKSLACHLKPIVETY